MIAVTILLFALLIAWTWVGYFLVTRFKKFFGPHKDDPSETPGARSFGLAHIVAVWVSAFALLIYFIGQTWT